MAAQETGRQPGGPDRGRRAPDPGPPRTRPSAFQQRVRNRQPDGGRLCVGQLAGEHDAPAGRVPAPDRAPATRTAAPGCTGARARANSSGPSSRSRRCGPRCITATRSARWRTTARSCAMNRYARPSSRLQVHQQVEDLRLDRPVERGDRLVEHEQLGFDHERAGDADALTLTAGELVRVAPLVLGDRARPARTPRARACAISSLRPAMRSGSAHDRTRASCAGRATSTGPGTRSAPGAGAPATARRERCAMSVPSTRIDAGGGFEQPDHQAGDGRFAAPRLPHQPERLARVEGEGHVVDRAHRATAAAGKCLTRPSTSSRGLIARGHTGRSPDDTSSAK